MDKMVKAARQSLYDVAGVLRWDRANKCIHIEGGDFFGSMTRLRSRLLERLQGSRPKRQRHPCSRAPQ